MDRLSNNSMTEESDWSYASKQKLAVVKAIKGKEVRGNAYIYPRLELHFQHFASLLRIISHSRGGGGGYSGEFLVGMCRPVLQILTLFQTKNVIFQTRFQDWPLGRNYVFIIYTRTQTKNSLNSFRMRIFLFLSYSLGIETINTFINSPISLENHTRFQTKMGKVYTRFQTKKAQKPYPMGRHIPI